MSYYYSRSDDLKINRLPSGLFFRVEQAEQLVKPPLMRSRDVGQSGISHHEVNYNNFVVPQYRLTKNDKELYLPLLEVSVEVEVVATIAWTKLTQTFKIKQHTLSKRQHIASRFTINRLSQPSPVL
jgi:hypothetical protein